MTAIASAFQSTSTVTGSLTTAIQLNAAPSARSAIYATLKSPYGSPVTTYDAENVAVWPFKPNWSSPMVETLDWLTDVITSFEGDEQRIELRKKPRLIFEYVVQLTGTDSARFHNLTFGAQNKMFVAPFWQQYSELTANVAITDTVLHFVTTNKRFFEGGLAILYNSTGDYEVVSITDITGDQVTIGSGLNRGWSPGTRVYPAYIGKVSQVIPFTQVTNNIVNVSILFQTEPIASDPFIPSGAASTTFNGYEVVLRKSNWDTGFQNSANLAFAELDYQSGGFLNFSTNDHPKNIYSVKWVIKGEADLLDFRKLLGRLKGRLKPVYLPTWREDFELIRDETSGSNTIRVAKNFFSELVGVNTALQTIVISLGTTNVIRRVTAINTSHDDYDVLTLNDTLGVNITTSTVKMICVAPLCRLTTDRIVINYLNDAVQLVETNFTLVKA
jgi:hypothetical protein